MSNPPQVREGSRLLRPETPLSHHSLYVCMLFFCGGFVVVYLSGGVCVVRSVVFGFISFSFCSPNFLIAVLDLI